MARVRLIVILVTALAFVSAACGGDDGDAAATTEAEGVASLQDEQPQGGSTTTTARVPFEEAALQFTACLRDQGIDVPDVQFGPNGQPIIDPSLIEDIDVGSADFTRAASTCLPIIQNAGVLEQELDPEQAAIIQDQLQEFSECMRENGITDFPDPDPTSVTSFPLSAFADFQDEDFQAALEVCQRITADIELGNGS
jgi:hypothetical protein